MTRRSLAKQPCPIFVVYVNYPSSSKEYAYLCDIPGIGQGDEVLANNTRVRVLRTAVHDIRAIRFVKRCPSVVELERTQRINLITTRLRQIETEQAQLDLFARLARKSPEAKKLLAELKRLVK